MVYVFVLITDLHTTVAATLTLSLMTADIKFVNNFVSFTAEGEMGIWKGLKDIHFPLVFFCDVFTQSNKLAMAITITWFCWFV